jgi:hypothetical protein
MTRSIPPAILAKWQRATVRLGASGTRLGSVVRVDYRLSRYVALVLWDGTDTPTAHRLDTLRIVEADGSGLESAT